MAHESEPAGAAVPAALYHYRFGNAAFDEADGRLRVNGEPVEMEPRPLLVLAELLRRPFEVVTKDELLQTVWQGRPTVDNVLANAVGKLRRAIGDADNRIIVNLPRIGYRLDCKVQRQASAQRTEQVLRFAVGEPVPGRESFVFERLLGGHEAQGPVWLARNAKLQGRRVFKFAADGERLRTLQREYTLYRLLHETLGEREDIARVLDARFGEPPFHLECAFGGDDLLVWAKAGQLAALTPDARLGLFMQVAQTIADAHGVGVLHKDLKPSNILVEQRGSDGRWNTRITDFGSGRLLEPQRLKALHITQRGLNTTQNVSGDSRSGTALYLAPELLAGGAATVQSDVYALGLLLFQLVVGDFSRPLSPGWERDIASRWLREDIAAATQGHPADRLKTVSELLQRLQRHDERSREAAQQEAAEHERAQAASRLLRYRARTPWLIAAAASLALGAAVSLMLFVQARDAGAAALAEAAHADALVQFLTEDVLQSANVTRAESARQVTMLDVLARASNKAEVRFAEQPLTQAAVRLELGRVYTSMRQLDAAERELRRAIELFGRAAPPGHGPALEAGFELAGVLAGLARFDEARALIDQTHARAEAAHGGRPPAPSRVLLAEQRGRHELANQSGDAQAALTWAQRANATAAQVAPDAAALRFALKAKLADAHWRLNQSDQATRLCGELTQPVPIGVIGAGIHAAGLLLCARIDISLGRYDQAEPTLLRVRNDLGALLGPQDYLVALAHMELATLHANLGRFDAARPYAQQALAALSSIFGAEHQTTKMAEANLAVMELAVGASQQALGRLDTVHAWFMTKFGDMQQPAIQGIDYWRVVALLDLKRTQSASALLERLDPARIAQAIPGPDWALKLDGQKARVLLQTGRRSQGLALLRVTILGMREAGSLPWQREALERDLHASSAATSVASR
jgi:eukaryotic-like serine/threonine-protein kinase